MNLNKINLEDIWPIKNKRFLVRVDFNVPIINGEVTSDVRIKESLPTINYIISHGGTCILLSHLGRPKGIPLSNIHSSHSMSTVSNSFIDVWKNESGQEKTLFFSNLPPSDKIDILKQSSLYSDVEFEKSIDFMSASHSGKTKLFSSLQESEKTKLLTLHNLKYHIIQQTQFPTLRSYNSKISMEEHSLLPVSYNLELLINQKVFFAPDCCNYNNIVTNAEGIHRESKHSNGPVILLENVRFYSEESSKNEEDRLSMARLLAKDSDYFVCDAFGTAHRNSASMTGIPTILGHGAAGYLVIKELNYYKNVLINPTKPLVAVIGGAKITDKIQLLKNLFSKIDILLIGGAMAYTFLKAKGANIGKSYCEIGQSYNDTYDPTINKEDNILTLALELLQLAKQHHVTIYLPIDHICHTSCVFSSTPYITEDDNIPNNIMGLDIGPKTLELYTTIINTSSKIVIWNGPMGVFEIDTYQLGTFGIAKTLARKTQENSSFLSIVGGGDSAAAINKCGVSDKISHVSTGGGASLELLEGKILPGIDVLDNKL